MTGIEIIWVEIKIDATRKMFLSTVYVPPDSNLSVCPLLEDSLDRLRLLVKPDDAVVIFGDFNMADVRWSVVDDLKYVVCNNSDSICGMSSRLLEAFHGHELRQHNSLPTCNNKSLDLVLSNDLEISVDHAVNPTSSTHQALDISLNLPRKSKTTPVQRTAYNFKKADFASIHRLLACICWSVILPSQCANEALSCFYDIIFAVIADCVPVKRYNASKFPHWYSVGLIALIKEKEQARRAFLRNGRDKNWDYFKNFSALRSQINVAQKACHANFVERISDEMKDNPKRFWSYVKTLKKSSDFPSFVTYNGVESSSLKDIVQVFCKYFESVFSAYSNDTFPSCPRVDVPVFRVPEVSANDMKRQILSLDRFTCTGYDRVSPIFLVECAEVLSQP